MNYPKSFRNYSYNKLIKLCAIGITLILVFTGNTAQSFEDFYLAPPGMIRVDVNPNPNPNSNPSIESLRRELQEALKAPEPIPKDVFVTEIVASKNKNIIYGLRVVFKGSGKNKSMHEIKGFIHIDFIDIPSEHRKNRYEYLKKTYLNTTVKAYVVRYG